MDFKPENAESSELKKMWQKILFDWKSSGLNISQYCKTHNISKHKFFYWKRKLIPTGPSLSLVPLEIKENSARIKETLFSVLVKDKYKIEIPDRFKSEQLIQIVKVLNGI